jgi:chemotaxis protein MotB
MMAIGYGEYRPRADNATAVGRNTNRRVNLVILGQGGDSRKIMQQRNQSLKALKGTPEPNEINEPVPPFNPIFDIQ